MMLDIPNTLSVLCATFYQGESGCNETAYFCVLDTDTWKLQYGCAHWSEQHDMPLPRLYDSEREMNDAIVYDITHGASFDDVADVHHHYYRHNVIEALNLLR